MKSGFLVTITSGRQPRTLLWDGHKPLPLGHPARWVLEHSAQGLQMRELAVRDGSHRCLLIPSSVLGGNLIQIPADEATRGRAVYLRIRKLRKPRAIFSPTVGSQSAASRWHQVLYCGMGETLLAHRDIGNFFRVHHGQRVVFTYETSLESHVIMPSVADLVLQLPDGRQRKLHPGVPERLSHYEWMHGTFTWRNHWWKVSYIPEPEKIARSVEQAAECAPQTIPPMKGFVTFASLLFAALMFAIPGKKQEPKIKIQTKIELKAPKLVEALPKPPPPPPPPKKIVEAPKPKPKPVAKKPVEAKPVKVAKKDPPKPKPKGPPPKQLAAKPPTPPPARMASMEKRQGPRSRTPQRVARAVAKPSLVPPQVPRISPQEIEARAQAQAARVAAQEAARQKAAAKAQLTQALGFLSTSASRPAVAVEAEQVADSANLQLQQRYDVNQAVADVSKTDSTYLNSMAEKGSDTRSISTRSARRISSDELAMGDGRAAGAGSVHGRVASSSLGGGDGSSLGSGLGGGLDVSGSGEVSEAEIEKALEKHLARFQYCYEKVLLADSSLAGTILLQWTINNGGRGQGVRVIRSQLNNNSLHDCLSGELARVQFPSPKGGAVIVKYPFAFSSGTL